MIQHCKLKYLFVHRAKGNQNLIFEIDDTSNARSCNEFPKLYLPGTSTNIRSRLHFILICHQPNTLMTLQDPIMFAVQIREDEIYL